MAARARHMISIAPESLADIGIPENPPFVRRIVKAYEDNAPGPVPQRGIR